MTKSIEYSPEGSVCSRLIRVEVDGEVIREVAFTGGCQGNTQGLAALIRGMHVDEAVARLRGIDCKGKGTSCPDQLAKALERISR